MRCTDIKRVIADAAISNLEATDAYMFIRGALFDLKQNANGLRVTEAFMDEIVDNKYKYIGDPLCADVYGLTRGKNIGHKYNELLDEYKSQIIGSMINFEKEKTKDGARCIFTAKVMKRYRQVCEAIMKLFADGKLKFSFELLCGEYEKLEDGTMIVDASDKNFLEGAAIVTYPACEEAVAMQLIAECINKGDENMNTENEMKVQAEEEAVTAEKAEETVEETVQPEAEQKEENEDEKQEEEPAAQDAEPEAENEPAQTEAPAAQAQSVEAESETVTENAESAEGSTRENATIYVTETEEVRHATYAYDSDTHQEVSQVSLETTSVSNVYEPTDEKVEDAEKEHEAVTENASAPESSESVMQAVLAELKALRKEVEELKNPPKKPERTVAEAAHEEFDLLNPFVSDIEQPVKFTLLEKSDTFESYSLLDPVED